MPEWTPPHIISDITRADSSRLMMDDTLLQFLHTLPRSEDSSGDKQPWRLQLVARNPSTTPALTLTRPDGVQLLVDFTQGKARYRAGESGGGIQTLARALGINAYRRRQADPPCVVDATGGLGQDAWALATREVKVTVFERHPIIYALLFDGLRRALADVDTRPVAERITLHHAAADPFLPTVNAHAIYLDPMYPQRSRKKAESRKGIQFLHALLGPPGNQANEDLLPAALKAKVNRVVVKRARGAPALPGSEHWHGQVTQVVSPNTRYDVYHVQRHRG